MGADAVMHFFGRRLLCENCYASEKESAMKTQAYSAEEIVPSGPLDLSFLPESDAFRPRIRTMKFNPFVVSIGIIIVIAIFAGVIAYHSGYDIKEVPEVKGPIYQDGDLYYLNRAYEFAKRMIIRGQRVPAKAAWPSADPIDDYVSYLEEQRYEVKSWYELSINQGRRFRQHFVVILKRVGDTWEKETLTFHSGEI